MSGNNSIDDNKNKEAAYKKIQKRIKEDAAAGRCEIFFRASDYDPELRKQKEEFVKKYLLP